ncbi:MAG: hypothetical protein ACR2QF_07045 [Geminicoccaceae bacterium]
MSKGKLFYVPIDTAITPKNGECIVDHWWSVHPEKGLVFWYQPTGYLRSEEPSPQCNQDHHTSQFLTKRTYPDHECRQIHVVYLGHAMQAMREDRERLAKEKAA